MPTPNTSAADARKNTHRWANAVFRHNIPFIWNRLQRNAIIQQADFTHSHTFRWVVSTLSDVFSYFYSCRLVAVLDRQGWMTAHTHTHAHAPFYWIEYLWRETYYDAPFAATDDGVSRRHRAATGRPLIETGFSFWHFFRMHFSCFCCHFCVHSEVAARTCACRAPMMI